MITSEVMGLTTALSPQVDLGTEPRWMRVEDTFGANPALVTDMGRAYCDGMQTDVASPTGWGSGSVAAMAKHWPGGGPARQGAMRIMPSANSRYIRADAPKSTSSPSSTARSV